MPIAHRGRTAAALLSLLAAVGPARADVVTLKNGTVYRGDVDKDDTVVSVFDDLTRVIVKDTKVARTETAPRPKYEVFRPVQPLDVHGGRMPEYAISIKAGPWDELGRRSFEFVGPRSSKPVRMTQAIHVLGPKFVQYRGIDGFWKGQMATGEVPRPVVLGLLAKVDQKNLDNRFSVNRFLIQAEWYPEALRELDRLAGDFPSEVAKVELVRNDVMGLEASRQFSEIKLLDRAQQPHEVLTRLKTFPTKGAATPLLTEVRDWLEKIRTRADEDKATAAAIRRAFEALPEDDRKAAKAALVEMLGGLDRAPDAVRDRFAAFRKADAEPGVPADARFALALSGWAIGSESAVRDARAAQALWTAREGVRAYVASGEDAERQAQLESLRGLVSADPAGESPGKLDLDAMVKVAALLPPPLRDPRLEEPGETRTVRVHEDPNPDQPSEYAVALPPEYHHLRDYPAIVALHDGRGPKSAVAWWADEAARNGYIVIAPEYNLRGQPRDYRYTPDEHAAVELALRDARQRFAIDPDRVFLAGALLGGQMAWDFGQSHPDQFAGAVVVSGLPGKYVWAYRDNVKRVPLFISQGNLAPLETSSILPMATGLIARNYDVTYQEHYQRGMEPFPEDRPAIFEWMGHRRRETFPKDAATFLTARTSDDRFYGVVVQEFAPGRVVAPELADPFGKNIKPASVTVQAKGFGKLLVVGTVGIKRLDVWVSPKQIDFSGKFEVRVNRTTVFRGAAKPELEPFLEDLRVRGDRRQVFAMKIPVNLGGRPGN